MMTDPNPHQASLRRWFVSESDVDPMITTTLRNDQGDQNLNLIYLVWDPVLIGIDNLDLED